MANFTLILRDKEDELRVDFDAEEQVLAILPPLADNPYLQRFMVTSGLIGAKTVSIAKAGAELRAEAPVAAAEPAREDVDPGSASGAATATTPPARTSRKAVRRVTADEVVNGARTEQDPNAIASAGLRLVVEKRTGTAPAEGITVGEAKALLAATEGGE